MSRHELIGVFIDPMYGYRDAVLDGIGLYLRTREKRWRPVVYHAESADIAPELRRWRGDGIICSAENAAMREAIAHRRGRTPLVSVTGSGEEHPYSVVADHRAVGALAADHLLEHALARYAYVGWDRAFANQRRDGFVDRLRSHGQSCVVIDAAGGALPELRRLSRDARPFGVFACDDALALDLLHSCITAGLGVPGEIAIVGAGNRRALCELSRPRLSSVDVDFERRGYEAAAMLDRLMSGEAVTSPVRIAPRYCHGRESTAAYGFADPSLRRAAAFIAASAESAISVGDVVQAAGVSRRKLEQLFVATLGRTIHEEIWRQHVACARRLLGESELSMHEIARRCGFSSASSFSTTFQRHTGKTPRQFRSGAAAERFGVIRQVSAGLASPGDA